MLYGNPFKLAMDIEEVWFAPNFKLGLRLSYPSRSDQHLESFQHRSIFLLTLQLLIILHNF